MLSTIQSTIDNFLSVTQLKTVSDIIFVPQDDEVVVMRRGISRKNVSIDVSDCASPSEVLERVVMHTAVY